MIYEIAAALLVNMVVGGLWYSPLMFGDVFIQTTGLKGEELSMGPGHIIGTILFALLECFGLYQAWTFMRCSTLMQAAKCGYLCWQFFVCPTIGVHFLYDQRPIKELLSKWGHHLASFVLEAIVIHYIAVTYA